jgi:hypothetical protein
MKLVELVDRYRLELRDETVGIRKKLGGNVPIHLQALSGRHRNEQVRSRHAFGATAVVGHEPADCRGVDEALA